MHTYDKTYAILLVVVNLAVLQNALFDLLTVQVYVILSNHGIKQVLRPYYQLIVLRKQYRHLTL